MKILRIKMIRLMILASVLFICTSCNKLGEEGKYAIVNTDRSKVGSEMYESQYPDRLKKNFSLMMSGTTKFEVVLKRLNINSDMNSQGSTSLGLPKGCNKKDYKTIENIFNLNKTSFSERQLYLKNQLCINHWYGADINQLANVLHYFQTKNINIIGVASVKTNTVNEIKSKILSSSKLKKLLFQRRILMSAPVAQFNRVFNTNIMLSTIGEIGYLGSLHIDRQSIANSIKGVVIVKEERGMVVEIDNKDKDKSRMIFNDDDSSSKDKNTSAGLQCGDSDLCYDKYMDMYCMKGANVGSGCYDKTAAFPREIAQIYDYPKENYGRGQSIAILSQAMDYERLRANINTFIKHQYPAMCGEGDDSKCPVPKAGVNVKIIGDFLPVIKESQVHESDLDLSVIASIAPQSDIYMVGKDASIGLVSGTYALYRKAIYTCLSGTISDSDCVHFNIISASVNDFNFNSYLQSVVDDLLEDAALRNITVITASGDLGSSNKFKYDIDYFDTTKPTFDMNSGSRYTTSVGGTSFGLELSNKIKGVREPTTGKKLWLRKKAFNDSQLSDFRNIYLGDEHYVWNDLMWDNDEAINISLFTENRLSSGGASLSARPQYQDNIRVSNFENCPNNKFCRIYPDIALSAGGSTKIVILHVNKEGDPLLGLSGGTSASAPLFAALIARINSMLSEKIEGFEGLGFVNPLLYLMSETNSNAFKDVTNGNNCSVFLTSNLGKKKIDSNSMLCYRDNDPALVYHAKKGFDLATGLGEPQGNALLNGIYQKIKKTS